MNNVRDLLEQIAATLALMHAQDLKQTFLLHCCAITLGILWGALTAAIAANAVVNLDTVTFAAAAITADASQW